MAESVILCRHSLQKVNLKAHIVPVVSFVSQNYLCQWASSSTLSSSESEFTIRVFISAASFSLIICVVINYYIYTTSDCKILAPTLANVYNLKICIKYVSYAPFIIDCFVNNFNLRFRYMWIHAYPHKNKHILV